MRKVFVLSHLLAGILFSLLSSAQLCTGSLGLPIVNNTFSAGTNPGASLSAATTTYQYVANDCPSDGFYTVRNNTNNCFSATWHSLITDHTGDANGYFMLVNASVQPGAFYVDTVRGLCSGTNFEFAAWVVNVLKLSSCGGNGNKPNLTFSIEKTDGTMIQTYSTGDINAQSVPQWQQYGFFFTTPIGVTDIVLRIVNNAPGGCGNDLALDDITFRPCGPMLSPAIVGFPTTVTSICEGVATTITFNCTVSAGFVNPTFQWQQSFNGGVYSDIAGQTTTNFTKIFLATTAPGIYTYRMLVAEAGNMSNPGCRVISPILTINVEASPLPILISNSPICANNTLQLTATGGTTYSWTGPNNFTASGSAVTIASAQPVNAGKYYVIVSSPSGCSKNDSITVVINPVPVAGVSFPTTTICESTSVQLTGTGGGAYLWSPSTGLSSATIPNPVASPVSTVIYRLIVSNLFNCTDTAFSEVKVVKKPVANAGPDKGTTLGVPVLLAATVIGDSISYSWSPSLYLDNPFIVQPMASPPVGEVEYKLTVTSRVGCGSDSDKVKVIVYNGLYIPTGFTPNNDGKNDTWFIPALSIYPEFELSVYNRYGNRILHTRNQQLKWGGSYKGLPQPTGVYIYLLSIIKDGKKELFKGTFTLIR